MNDKNQDQIRAALSEAKTKDVACAITTAAGEEGPVIVVGVDDTTAQVIPVGALPIRVRSIALAKLVSAEPMPDAPAFTKQVLEVARANGAGPPPEEEPA